MHKTRWSFPLIISLTLLLAMISSYSKEAQPGISATPSTDSVAAVPAPDFSLLNAKGQRFALRDFRGHGVIVLFWATWCPYCARLMPGLEQYYQKLHARGLDIIAVDILDDGDPIAHMKTHGFTFTLGQKGDDVAKQWGVTGTPTLFFISPQGNVIAREQISDPKSARLRQLIQKIMPSQPTTRARQKNLDMCPHPGSACE